MRLIFLLSNIKLKTSKVWFYTMQTNSMGLAKFRTHDICLHFPAFGSIMDLKLALTNEFCYYAAPHLTGFSFKLFVNMLEAPLIGSLIVDSLKKDNGMTKVCFYQTDFIFVCLCCWFFSWFLMVNVLTFLIDYIVMCFSVL